MQFHQYEQLHRERERDLRNELVQSLARRQSHLRRAAQRRERRAERLAAQIAILRRATARTP